MPSTPASPNTYPAPTNTLKPIPDGNTNSITPIGPRPTPQLIDPETRTTSYKPAGAWSCSPVAWPSLESQRVAAVTPQPAAAGALAPEDEGWRPASR
jgi:hypothetical protein